MGNSVTTTPIEKLKIDETNDDFEDNDISVGFNTNAINGTNYDNYNIEPQNHFPQQQNIQDQYNQDWNDYQQQYMGYPNQQNPNENDLSINERIEKLENIPDFNDETSDVLNDIKEAKPLNDLNTGLMRSTINANSLDKNLPVFRRSIDDNNDIHEIDDLESIESGSKLTLNDVKSDTEDVIQELNKLNLDLEDNSDKYPSNYRKRGQSWSTWDNNVHVDLKAESSLSSFSRPASIMESTTPVMNGIKTKSYTAPESRGREDNAIEWLAKQHGLEMGGNSDSEHKQKPIESSNNRHFLKQSKTFETFEVPGSVRSISSANGERTTDNELQLNYDELDQQLINDIENMR